MFQRNIMSVYLFLWGNIHIKTQGHTVHLNKIHSLQTIKTLSTDCTVFPNLIFSAMKQLKKHNCFAISEMYFKPPQTTVFVSTPY